MPIVDFATFCHKGDAHRLHAPGQLREQVESNSYVFNQVIVVHQLCNPADYAPFDIDTKTVVIDDLDEVLIRWKINLGGQYRSNTDQAHFWKYHVVNHLAAIEASQSDYIVFADADCWIVSDTVKSWITEAIGLFEINPFAFIVSPNDGEPERATQRMSQQMFMARTKEFRQADFNQPGWDGNVHIPGGPIPEYWGMLEGRMELWCQQVNKYRYVLGPEHRYFHHNRLDENDMYDTDYKKLGWF